MPTISSHDKIFHAAHFTLHQRRVARAHLCVNAQPAYTLLCVTDGALHWKIETEQFDESLTGEIASRGLLLVNPDEAASAHGEKVGLLHISLNASFVLECAVRAALVRDDALIRFHTRIIQDPPDNTTTNVSNAKLPDVKLLNLIRALSEELNEPEAGHKMMLTSLVEQTVIQLLRRHADIRRDAGFELSRVGLVDRRIRRAVELMHNALERDLSLEEIAAAAYLSPFHFARLFKKATGATPHAYLGVLRIARAKELLANTDLSVTEISARVGYQSASHFTKAFRQSTGLAPREFRRALAR